MTDKLIEALERAKDALNTVAVLSLKSERYARAIQAKQDIADVLEAHRSQQESASPDAKGWARYVAGMVVAYLGGGVDDDRIEPIAGIIARRLWALPASPAPSESEAEGEPGLFQTFLDAAMAAPQQPLKVGDRIKDNDYRMGNRILTIVVLAGEYVQVKDRNGHESRLLVRRIHTDDKLRKSGFSLIKGTK